MTKKCSSRVVRFGIGLAVLSLVLAGCNLDGRPSDLGTVVLRVGPAASARTFEPDNVQVTKYVVRGTGPVGQTPEWEFNASESSLTMNDLMAGMWRFNVFGLNSDGKNVLGGAEDVHVVANDTRSADVVISPIAGNGTFVIVVQWPADSLNNPTFEAELSVFEGGSFGSPVTIENASFNRDNPNRARHSSSRAAGYYEVHVTAVDASVGLDETVTNTARVMTDLTTTVIVEVEPGEGGASITVVEDRQNPLSVSLSPSSSVVNQGDSLSVSSSVSGGGGSYTYRWFLNGALQSGASGSSVSLGPDLPLGRHNLSLVASDGTVLGSDSISFDVVP